MLTLPASIQQLVGRRLLRISTSADRDKIIFDTLATASNSRTRYAYSLSRGHVDRLQNISQVLGNKVESVSALDRESTGQEKMQITSDKGTGVIYFSSIVGSVARITEDGSYRTTEQSLPIIFLQEIRVTEVTGTVYDITLSDLSVDKRPPYELDSSGDNFAVEEGNVDYGILYEDGES